MKYRICFVLAAAVLGGFFLAFSYINPYFGTIPLSELVLQLSGSRGEFPLEPWLNQLIALAMRMIPGYVLEAWLGVELYRHFCTASIYVFSRRPNRLRWYFRQAGSLALAAFSFQLLLLLAAVLTTVLRYQVTVDAAGIALFLAHWILHAVWVYSMTMLVNLLSIPFGSSTAFMAVIGIQAVLIALLKSIQRIPKTIVLNPMAHLVLGWQSSGLAALKQALAPPYPGLSLELSLPLMLLLGCGITALGAAVVHRHDLLVADIETGG